MEIVTLERTVVRSALGKGRVGHHDLLFAEPRGLWPGGGGRGAAPAGQAPVILRYRGDDFMERFLATIRRAVLPDWTPLTLAEHAAELDEGEEAAAGGGSGGSGPEGAAEEKSVPVRWLSAPASAAGGPAGTASLDLDAFKLFLPYHGDFHLVTCSFLCRHPGWPDHPPDPDRCESVAFLLRRQRRVGGAGEAGGTGGSGGARPAASEEIEEAWIPEVGWVSAGTPDAPLPREGEERLPLVRIQGAAGHRIYKGYLPLTSGDTYEAGEADPLAAAGDVLDAFDTRVGETLGPLKAVGREEGWTYGRALWDLLDDEVNRVRRYLMLLTGETRPPWITLTPQEQALATHLEVASETAPLPGSWKDLVERARSTSSAQAFSRDLVRIPPSAFDRLESLVVAAEPGAAAPVDGVTGPYRIARDALDAARDERLERSFDWCLGLLESLELGAPAAAEALRSVFDEAAGSGSLPDPPPSPALPPEEEVGAEVRALLAALWSVPVDRIRESDTDPRTLAQALWILLRLREAALETLLDEAEILGELFDPNAPGPDGRPAWEADVRGDWEIDVARVPSGLLGPVRARVAEAGRDLQLPKFAPAAPVESRIRYVVRCIYEKACCRPPRILLSQASAPFVPASVFDPDAPARDIRIPFPMDFSLKALKKARRGVGVMLSNELKQKMGRATPKKIFGMEIPMPSFGGGGPGFGVIWTLSIPIVTICALILLLIVATILHIIFRWLPYLIVAYPVRLNGSSQS